MLKKIPSGVKTLLIIGISLLVGFYFGTNQVDLSWKKYTPILSVKSKEPPAGQNLDMKMFYDIFDRVNMDYYDKTKIDANKMLQGAVNGMLATLGDPYTSYFPPKQNTEFKTQLAGEFSGIGSELSLSPDNKIVVVAPLDDSPSEKAGIKPGDIVLSVDGEDTTGWTVAQAVDKIRGPRGSTVTLSILHEKSKTPVNLKIVRDTIVIKSVAGWVKNFTCDKEICREDAKGKPIAYIRISQFGDKTNNEWTTTVNSINTKLAGKSNTPMILDLRSNPGGYLTDAVFIVSEFVDRGVVVIQENGAKQQEPMVVSRRGTLLSEPLIVLINKGSASASEITAGALRDHKRAKLLGETSFGKGTVQQAVDLDGGGSIHVSVARWLTPNQTWVDKKGLEPDIKVAFDASKSAKLAPGIDNQLQSAIMQLVK